MRQGTSGNGTASRVRVGGLNYALGGILATVGFFLPWVTFQAIGMPDHSVATYSAWSGWSTTLPVGVPILAGSLIAVVLGLVVIVTGAARPKVCSVVTGLGGLTLVVVTVLLLIALTDPGVPRYLGPPPQVSVGLLLTYLGFGISIRSCFLMSVRRSTLQPPSPRARAG